ncbi:MAG: response regulator transcription factor [Slackia sp.]
MRKDENPGALLTEERVAELSAEKGLSARESEVLGYLAKGRSQPYIREELVLSKNTVATHVKHIYQKLGVHSKQELLDLFEG